jgi:serine/threonine-protein kinase
MSESDPVGELLLRWEDGRAGGATVTPEELCRDCPEHLADLRARIAALQAMDSLLSNGPSTAPAAETPADSVEPGAAEPAVVGCYQVVRPHARGGLGEVLLAEDGELRRPVALKRIHGRQADNPDCRRRFLREAEITARLQHPGIVPVYGLTRDEHDRPYYAMRFIEGESLAAAVERFHAPAPGAAAAPTFDSLEFHQLLAHFVAVCNAVAYAHSRGVVHRDLKPANVMLGEFGETLVVDWGLAKALRQPAVESIGEVRPPVPGAGDGGETAVGQAVGTPAFMSPEQAAGAWDELGPAADIFSLGAVLYTILTGRPPYQGGHVATVLEKARRCDFAPPRPGVPRALAAVCLKAMTKTPTDRYATAKALAADVERWLADEPVAAYREPAGARLRRWVRRHAKLVTGIGVALAAGVAALGLLAWQREQARAAVAAEQAQTAKERDATAAERDRAVKARARTREALDAAVSGITDITHDSRATKKVLSDEQKTFLRNVLGYYEEFAAEPGEDREGRERLAHAHRRLGAIRFQLDQPAEGTAVFRRAVELYAGLAADFPAVPEYRGHLASCHDYLGLMLDNAGRWADAEAARRASLAVSEKLAADFPAEPRYRRYLALSQDNLSTVLFAQGKLTEAVAAQRAALAQLEKLAADFPAEPDYRRDLASSQDGLGTLLAAQEKQTEAEAARRASLAVSEKLAADFPAEPNYRQRLVHIHSNLGDLLADSGKRSEAEAEYRAALAIQEKLAADFPAVPEYAIAMGGTYNAFASFLSRTGRCADAVAWHAKTIDRLAPLVAAQPHQLDARLTLCIAHSGRGSDLAQLGRHSDALPDWERALELHDGLARTELRPGRDDWLAAAYDSARAGLRLGRADCLARLGRAAAAAAAAEELTAADSASTLTLYECARVFAVAAAAPNNPASDAHAARAVAVLRQAFAKGDLSSSHLWRNADFVPLLSRPDYAALLWDLADLPVPMPADRR